MVDMTKKKGSTRLGPFLNVGEGAEGYVAAPASDPRQLHAGLHLSGLGDVYCVPALRPLRGTELA